MRTIIPEYLKCRGQSQVVCLCFPLALLVALRNLPFGGASQRLRSKASLRILTFVVVLSFLVAPEDEVGEVST